MQKTRAKLYDVLRARVPIPRQIIALYFEKVGHLLEYFATLLTVLLKYYATGIFYYYNSILPCTSREFT